MHLHSHLRRLIGLSLKLALTAGMLWLALKGADFRSMPALLASQSPYTLSLAAALLLTQILLGGVRWSMVLKALTPKHPSPGAPEVQKVYYVSMFFNCCLPGAVGGDVMRLWLARSFHLPFAHIVSSVILDRVLTLIGLFLLAACALPSIGTRLTHGAWLASIAVLAASAAGFCLLPFIGRFLGRWDHWPLVHRLRWLIRECYVLCSHWRLALPALLLAIASHACFALAGYFIARGLHIHIGVAAMMGLMPLVMLMVVLPISVGGWGVREASVVGLLGALGAPHSAALALSVEMGLITTLVTVPGGLMWFWQRKADKNR